MPGILTSSPGRADGAPNVGNGTIGALSAGRTTMPGVWRITMTSPTAFMVLQPGGAFYGTGAGRHFGSMQLNFAMAPGPADFAAGDGFDVSVQPHGADAAGEMAATTDAPNGKAGHGPLAIHSQE